MNLSQPDRKHPNAQRYLELIRAFNANNLDEIARFFHPEFIYTIPGKSPIAERTVGLAAHLRALRNIRDRSNGTLRFDPFVVAADGDFVLALGRILAERKGKRLDTEHCVIFRFSGDLIVEGRTVPLDLYAFDDFWE